MRCHGNHRDLLAAGAGPIAYAVARRRWFAKPAGRYPGPGQQLLIPLIAFNIQELGGAGIGVFPVQLPRQAKVQVIRDQQQVSHAIYQLGLLFTQSTQLVQRIERQELNTGALIDIAAAQILLGCCHQPLSAGITVGNGLADPLTLRIQQDKIHAPGIYADAIKANAFCIKLRECLADIAFQRIQVPAVLPGPVLQTVGEAADFTQLELLLLRLIARQHHSSTGGSKVDGDSIANSHERKPVIA